MEDFDFLNSSVECWATVTGHPFTTCRNEVENCFQQIDEKAVAEGSESLDASYYHYGFIDIV